MQVGEDEVPHVAGVEAKPEDPPQGALLRVPGGLGVRHQHVGVGLRPMERGPLTPPHPHLVGHAGGRREQQGRDGQLPAYGGQ